jgi:hypothetical protein
MATRSVLIVLPSAEAQELLAELALDLGLEVRLIQGRVTERDTRLALEIDGDPEQVREGCSRCAVRSRRGPSFCRTS